EAPGWQGARRANREVEHSEMSSNHECTRDARSVASTAHIGDMQPTSNAASRDASALECSLTSETGH
ncbi:MAG: hypothetical protein KAI76_05485, partial [Alphaproteobacteria bacterium]|nr:hypothetical protein [Alphaproteobacteria bacterium]